MNNISFESLTLDKISDLARENYLYVYDYRVLGESFEHSIPEMWKTENWVTFMHLAGRALVNGWVLPTSSPDNNLQVEIPSDPRISIISRFVSQYGIDFFSKYSISSIYNFLPHPDIEEISRQAGISCRYTMDCFNKYNNKREIKLFLGDSTWNPKIVQEHATLSKIYELKSQHYYLKRIHGSGGYRVLDLSSASDQVIDSIPVSDLENWYIEEGVKGEPTSVQCYTDSYGHTIVYGFCRQIIRDGQYFEGGQVVNFDEKLREIKFINTLKLILERVTRFITGYEGFWGLDFIEYKGDISFIEANIRPTAMTIPTLLVNARSNSRVGLFRENVPEDESFSSDSIIIAKYPLDRAIDLLTFN